MSNNKEKTNIELHESAKNFLNYLHTIKNRSDETIIGYSSNLRIFFEFLKIKKKKAITNKLLKTITLDDLYNFLSYTEKELRNSPATRARKVACLKSYFHYLYKKAKLIPEDITEELDSPKIPKKKPISMNLDQCKQLLNSLDDWSAYYFRDKAILTIFLQCGLRLSELCNIKINDIKGTRMIVTGKGDKQRYVFLSESCIKVINEYLKERKDDKASDEDKQYLFLSDRQQRIRKTTVQTLVKKHMKKAGLDTDLYHTHTTRHSYATMSYNQGMDVIKLSEALGHSNVNTSKVYVTINEDELQDYANNNPLNNL